MPTAQELNIPDKLDSILGTKQAIREAIVSKGTDVPEGTTFRQYADLISGISTGLSDADLALADATPEDVTAGKTFYAGDRTLKTGTASTGKSTVIASGSVLVFSTYATIRLPENWEFVTFTWSEYPTGTEKFLGGLTPKNTDSSASDFTGPLILYYNQIEAVKIWVYTETEIILNHIDLSNRFNINYEAYGHN